MSLYALFAAAALAADPFDACDVELPSQPEGREAYRCYYVAARRTGDYDRAIARIGELKAERPTSGWARLTYANLLMDQFDPTCREHYVAALEMLTAAGDVRGEVYSALALAKFLHDQGQAAERDALLARAVGVAERSGDRTLWSAAQLQQARFWVAEGSELGEAERILLDVEPHVFPGGEYQAKVLLVNTLVNLYFATGRPDEGTAQLARLAELSAGENDAFVRAAALSHLAELVVADPEGTSSIHGGDPLGFVRSALDAARAGGNPAGEVAALAYVAQLDPDAAAGDAMLAEALAIAEESGDPTYVIEALQGWADAVAVRDPDRSLELSARAEALARDYDLLDDLSYAAWSRAAALWAKGDREGSRAAADLAFDRWEQLRDSNTEDTSKARYGAGGAWWYHEEAGRWLASGGTERAWAVSERMRAVSVRAALDRDASSRKLSADAQAKLAEVEHALATERERLWEELGAEERGAVVTRLEALRADRGRLLEGGGLREPVAAAPIALADVQAALGDDEILLSFLVPDPHATREPARVIRVSRASVDVFALPAPAGLTRRVDVFLGLVSARDGAEAAPAAALYAELLGEALADVPDGSRVVVVPDGPLHRLPLGLLRASADGPPLATRLELSVAPSATVWHRWRTRPLSEPIAAWAILSDPALADASLPRLPRARAEADRVRSTWSGALRLEDAAASEAALRAAVEGRGGLYFAAHAVTDEVYPERSAIVLAADGADDGRLTAAEIALLPLQDRLVVLSACRSASGRVTGGEGPLGLSRAFFRAGARAVVGSLWPLRDDDAEALFDAFTRHLAAGAPAGRALAEAQRERLSAGAPAEAWAGVVLLGDATVRAPGTAGALAPWVAAGLAALGAAGAAAFAWRRYPGMPG